MRRPVGNLQDETTQRRHLWGRDQTYWLTPFWRVVLTPYPNVMAPKNSIAPPISSARLSPIAPLPTEVPQELAESFAPIPKAMRHMTNPPRITVHSISSGFLQTMFQSVGVHGTPAEQDKSDIPMGHTKRFPPRPNAARCLFVQVTIEVAVRTSVARRDDGSPPPPSRLQAAPTRYLRRHYLPT